MEMEVKNKARQKNLQQNTRASERSYSEARKSASRTCREKKRRWEREELERIEELHSINESRQFYKELGVQRQEYVCRLNVLRNEQGEMVTNNQQVLMMWRDHFSELLNPAKTSLSNHKTILSENQAEDRVEAPTIDEIRENIKCLKNHKAPGQDGILAELMKNGGEQLEEDLFQLIAKIWEEEKCRIAGK